MVLNKQQAEILDILAEPVEDEAEEPVPFGGDASPLMRALPQYERQFRWHVKVR